MKGHIDESSSDLHSIENYPTLKLVRSMYLIQLMEMEIIILGRCFAFIIKIALCITILPNSYKINNYETLPEYIKGSVTF